MPKVEKFVAVGEVQKASSDSVEAEFCTAHQEVRAYAGRGLFRRYSGGFILHGGLVSDHNKTYQANYHAFSVAAGRF